MTNASPAPTVLHVETGRHLYGGPLQVRVAVLQAASCGVPVVATSVGGIPDFVRDQLNGILVPSGDSAAIARAVSDLLTDPSRARELGRAGRVIAIEEFSIDVMTEGTLEIWSALSTPGR
jgi:glycosyltransferase involved in cell wall biosynthesis